MGFMDTVKGWFSSSKQVAGQAVDKGGDVAKTVASKSGDVADKAWDKTKDVAGDVGQKAKEVVEDVKNRFDGDDDDEGPAAEAPAAE